MGVYDYKEAQDILVANSAGLLDVNLLTEKLNSFEEKVKVESYNQGKTAAYGSVNYKIREKLSEIFDLNNGFIPISLVVLVILGLIGTKEFIIDPRIVKTLNERLNYCSKGDTSNCMTSYSLESTTEKKAEMAEAYFQATGKALFEGANKKISTISDNELISEIQKRNYKINFAKE